MMKTLPVRDAIGLPLAHDLTQIIPGRFKGSRFKKGHIVREEDIPILLGIGKEHLFVLDLEPDLVHEDEAARRLALAAAGRHIELSEPSEGKIELTAAIDGLLKINVSLLDALNGQEEIMFATLHTDQMVTRGQKVAGTRVIPLAVREQVIRNAENLCVSAIESTIGGFSGGATGEARETGEPARLVEVKPLRPHTVGIVTTGSEVFNGTIRDAFGPVLKRKFEVLGSRIHRQILASDEEDRIVAAIHELIAEGADFIAVTGGMSVDPDDRTPASIRKSGAEVITYGAPVLPGAMFLLAFIGDIPVVGLPGCVMYHATSIFDLIIPRLLAGERPTRQEIKSLGHGGLCRGCEPCRFPICGFGRR